MSSTLSTNINLDYGDHYGDIQRIRCLEDDELSRPPPKPTPITVGEATPNTAGVIEGVNLSNLVWLRRLEIITSRLWFIDLVC